MGHQATLLQKLRGLVKLKKFQNPRKTRIGQTSPTHPPIQFLFFLRNFWNMTTTQKTQKDTKLQKKYKSELRLVPTHPLPSFFRNFGFVLTWQNPLILPYHDYHLRNEMNGVFGHLCAHILNWTTSWGWWAEWYDTALQTQDSKFVSWRSEAEYATSRSRMLPTTLNLYECALKKRFVFFKLEGQSGGSNPQSPTSQTSSFNLSLYYNRANNLQELIVLRC